MTNRNFDEWLSKFRPSISSYDYYIDFAKVVRNVDEIKVELNILNSLIASKNIEEEFEVDYTAYMEAAAIEEPDPADYDKVSGNFTMCSSASCGARS